MMEAMNWAFALKKIPAISKLLAIHIASKHGQSRFVKIDACEACEFCGLGLLNLHEQHIDADGVIQRALQAVPGISFEKINGHEFMVDGFNVFGETQEP